MWLLLRQSARSGSHFRSFQLDSRTGRGCLHVSSSLVILVIFTTCDLCGCAEGLRAVHTRHIWPCIREVASVVGKGAEYLDCKGACWFHLLFREKKGKLQDSSVSGCSRIC